MERVLDYHNKKHGTHIVIRGESTDIYPHLQGKRNWDWVCYDRETGNKIAIEVKRITNEETENQEKFINNLLHEIVNGLSSDILSGNFILEVDIDYEYSYFPFKKQPTNKQMFKDALSNAIKESVKNMKVGETIDLKPKINEKLPFQLPSFTYFHLQKMNDRGKELVLEQMEGGFPSELQKFEQLVSHANKQLKEADAEKTFLVFIEEGYNPTDPPEIAEAFRNIENTSYSEIKHVYFIRSGEIVEIPLPTP